MKIYKFAENVNMSNSVLCLGDFDGMHRGHRAVFAAAKSEGNWGVLLFDRNSKGKPVITSLEEKLDILRGIGADFAAVTAFDETFSHMTPEMFAEFIKNEFDVKAVAAGSDYRFGYKACGDVKLLKKLCGAVGIKTIIADLASDTCGPIKSTRIRELIAMGDMRTAAELLGMNFFVSGKVEHGLKNGRNIGFPTANIEVPQEKILPTDGVYAGVVCGKKAVVNIGKNPTFDATMRTVEAHIIDFDGDLYGRNLKVELIDKIRGEIKFKTIEELSMQIQKDVKTIKERMS